MTTPRHKPWLQWGNLRNKQVNAACEELKKAQSAFYEKFNSMTLKGETKNYDINLLTHLQSCLSFETYKAILNKQDNIPQKIEHSITAFNTLPEKTHENYRTCLKLLDEIDNAAVTFLEAWKDFVNSDNVSRIVISIGSHCHNSNKQTIPEFVYTAKNSRTAILNIDSMLFDDSLSLHPAFSCAYMRYRLNPPSKVFDVLQNSIKNFISSDKQVAVMSFVSPLFFEKLKPLFEENIEALGSKFSYVHGYFSSLPIIILNKDALLPANYKVLIEHFPQSSSDTTVYDGGKMVANIDELSLEQLFPYGPNKTNTPNKP